MTVSACAPSTIEQRIRELRAPPGIRIDAFTTQVPDARQLAFGSKGTLFVGTRREGRIYAVLDTDGDGSADAVKTIASGLSMPSGVAFKDGDLYVAATDRVLRFRDIEARLDEPPAPSIVTDRLPRDEYHGWRYLKAGPDGHLYVSVGSPCNACTSSNPLHASILRLDPSNGALEIVARGVRNSVGFDWHPTTKQLWFSDNGRDLMGDDVPEDEVNVLQENGQHFGFPYVHAGSVPDPDLGGGAPSVDFEPPILGIQAHSAPLGVAFFRPGSLPLEYQATLFIAEHGSWNRAEKVGYRLSMIRLDGDTPKYEPFVEGWLFTTLGGWLQGKQYDWGRPTDVAFGPDGCLYVSDDEAGVIYRISYQI